MAKPGMTRRSVGAMAAFTLVSPAAGEEIPAAIRELGLPPELRAELEQQVRRAIKEARWLEELPLDGIDPGFVFQAE